MLTKTGLDRFVSTVSFTVIKSVEFWRFWPFTVKLEKSFIWLWGRVIITCNSVSYHHRSLTKCIIFPHICTLLPDTWRGKIFHFDHLNREMIWFSAWPCCSALYLLSQYRAHKGKFPASFFNSHAPVAQSKRFVNAREVMEAFLLKPAEYLIVPSTFGPNETALFLLTIIHKGEAQG